jgi:hypothetical protein
MVDKYGKIYFATFLKVCMDNTLHNLPITSAWIIGCTPAQNLICYLCLLDKGEGYRV